MLLTHTNSWNSLHPFSSVGELFSLPHLLVAYGKFMDTRRVVADKLTWRNVDWAAPLWQLLSALERVSCLHPLSIIARKRLDISFFPDICGAIRLSLQGMLPGGAGESTRAEAALAVSRAWTMSIRASDRCLE